MDVLDLRETVQKNARDIRIDSTGHAHLVTFHQTDVHVAALQLPAKFTREARQLSNTDAAYHFLEWAEHYEL